MLSIEEYIQNPVKRHILGKLLKNKSLKYSELMPEDVDNVLFNYHLQHLVKNGILDKKDNIYSLSPKGHKFTANITDSGLFFPKFVCRFRLYIINENKVLMQYRKRTCWQGDTAALSSKVVYGMGTEERAATRVKEKSGLEVAMKWAGTVRTLVFNSQKDLVDDSIYLVCYGHTKEWKHSPTDDTGDPLSWHTFDEAIEFEKKNKQSGEKTVEILKRFKAGNFESFSFEERITSDST